MEVEVEGQLEARPVVRGLAAKTGLRRQVEQDRQVRPQAAGRDVLEGPEVLDRQAGAVALVRQRGIGESRAHDADCGRERRADHLLDELAAGGVEQQRVGERVDRPVAVARGVGQVDPLAEGLHPARASG
jgi:hypothetical protein